MTGQIICRADGDRCLGCAHYRGEADDCEFARHQRKAAMTEKMDKQKIQEFRTDPLSLHVACSPLTATIYCGGVCKDGTTWRANKTDVTGEACAAVAMHALAKGGEIVVTENGKPKWTITVQEHAPHNRDRSGA